MKVFYGDNQILIDPLAIGKSITLDTYFFNDTLKFELYHKKNAIKSNRIGKATVLISSMVFDNLDFVNKKENHTCGHVSFKTTYSQWNNSVFDP